MSTYEYFFSFGVPVPEKIEVKNMEGTIKVQCLYSEKAKSFILGEALGPDNVVLHPLTKSKLELLGKQISKILEKKILPEDIHCWLLRDKIDIDIFYGHCIDGCVSSTPYEIGWDCIAPNYCKNKCIKWCGYSHIWGQMIPIENLREGQSSLPFKKNMPDCWKKANLDVIQSDDPPWISEYAILGRYINGEGTIGENGKFDFSKIPVTASEIAKALMLPESKIDMYWSFDNGNCY